MSLCSIAADLYAFKPITGLHKLLHTNFVFRILLKPHLFLENWQTLKYFCHTEHWINI